MLRDFCYYNFNDLKTTVLELTYPDVHIFHWLATFMSA